MPTLNVTVINKIATGDRQLIVCDNTDYTVHFELDAEWDAYDAKTMRVLYADNTYDEILFTGTDCPLPRIYNAQSIKIGIYAGDLHATAAAVYDCKKSVLTDGSQHPNPPEDIYNQIMDAITSGVMDGVGIDNILKTATVGLVDTYTITYTNGTTTTFDVTNGAQGTSITNIAKTDTSGNVDTYTITMSNGDTYTFTVTNGAVTSVDGLTGDVELDYKANIDGYYDGLTSGTTNQILSDKTVTDNAPFVFRPSGGGNHIGDRKEIKEVVGSSVVWNQLVDGSFENNTWWTKGSNVTTFTVSNNEATIVTTSGTSNFNLQRRYVEIKKGHKYFVHAEAKLAVASNTARLRFWFYSSTQTSPWASVYATATTEWTAISTIAVADNDFNDYMRVGVTDSAVSEYTYYLRNVMLIDLTPTSSAIADRAYTLDQTTAGSGIAWLQSYGFFTKPYYAYTASPSIQSVKVSAHETVGLNQWDEEWELGGISQTTGENGASSTSIRSKNYIEVFPNTTYYIKAPQTIRCFWYDGNKNYIGTVSRSPDRDSNMPSSVCYMRFTMGTTQLPVTTYNNDICINLHGDRDGEYEAYHKNTYAFDSTKTLNGVLKLDNDGNIYAYGDRYHNVGSIDGVFEDVDLGSLTWNYDSTNGVFYSGSGASLNAKENVKSAICSKYVFNGSANSSSLSTMASLLSNGEMCSFSNANNVGRFVVKDSAYTDATTFTTAITGVKLIYEVATPTTETADSYQQVMTVFPEGTERWVDAAYEAGDRDFEMPVGHSTEYHVDLKAKLEAMPDGPSSDGDYLLRRRNGVNTYVRFVGELPAEPTEDGVYTLTATVSGGVATYSWEA